MANCNKCKSINITEEEHKNKSEAHVCLIHKVEVFHRNAHVSTKNDYIHHCKKCGGKDFTWR